ncbi:type II inositol 1,4,5-trisphosphate 5-phosphatase isoform X3 [Sorex araneus]|uniref:type II inositol 1,4,5-trisphosphate 5-phosphatase isoform X3 n=1 Tax=Sorex araneus TaxID=42254 RepID=UPI002433B763|nr:type II inositol 1,4,5-trisphosphate 5-phosphatase isoform X3 [Sorex araneus]
MDQSVAIQETLDPAEYCVIAVQAVLCEGNSRQSRLLGLVRSCGKLGGQEHALFLYTHRRMAITGDDVSLDQIVPLSRDFTLEEVLPEGELYILGSDVTVQLDTAKLSLLFQLPFGSHSRLFLQEVARACPGFDSTTPDPEFLWLSRYRCAKSEPEPPVPRTWNSAPGASHLDSSKPNGKGLLVDQSLCSQDRPENLPARQTKTKSEISEMVRSSTVTVSDKAHMLSVQQFRLRDTMVKSQLVQKEEDYTYIQNFRFFVGTYNVNGQSPKECLKPWLCDDIQAPDVYCVGFQELDLSKEAFFFHDAPKEEEWFKAVSEALHPEAKYAKVKLIRLVGIMLLLYVKQEHAAHVSEVEAETVGTGIMGRMLRAQMAARAVFEGFTEGELTFQPTYKYDTGSDDWDTSEKCRAPAWCDRILWKGKNITQLSYQSHMALKTSDHKPVSSVFDIGVRVVNEELYRKTLEEIVRSLDKMENASIPSVSLSKREFCFQNVKFMELKIETFVIHNGQVPCQFEFINKPDETWYCKQWLNVNPSRGYLLPDSDVEIVLELFVNKTTATQLNSGEDKIEDILVLHLDRGKDYFLSVSGNYLPSCFGSPIHTLCHMKKPILHLPLETIRELTLMPLRTEDDGNLSEKPLEIPKELWLMVDYLYQNAMEQEDLFQQPGIRSHFENIRDYLDTGKSEDLKSVSNHSVAEALLLFLESLPEPVICYSAYHHCLECAGNYPASKQVVSTLPEVHRNVFNYLMAFLQELLKNSAKNHLDENILASLFGSLLLRNPAGHQRLDTAEKKKAQEFIHQYLCNSS